MDVRGCLIPSLDITESPNPFQISGLLVNNIGPLFQTEKIYKDIFSYIYRDPNTRTKLGGDSEKFILGLYFFFKIKILSQNFPLFSKQI